MSHATKALPREHLVDIPAGFRHVRGILALPERPEGVVAFAHGSGSGRFSPRNQQVAAALRDAGLATLLVDLLEEDEARDRRNVFDIGLLASRVVATVDWLDRDPRIGGLRQGLFGASTGAAAALVAAARRPESVAAVVSRGGRPDLAADDLAEVRAPTLLLVGGQDVDVLDLNRRALRLLTCPGQLVVIPGATHLFPEPGALGEVSRLAAAWFITQLTTRDGTH
ncbi:MAG TPA: dienelactone hydrolase family protein [Isosphaeraceae bacterium]|jgi:putative phosphoribosyl transferase|nr:dienelactone hydrolase family protein [Isosphaeraceae bacterium]